jgi:hypothetical protein
MFWGDRLSKSLTTLTGKADIASAGEMVSAFAKENNLATTGSGALYRRIVGPIVRASVHLTMHKGVSANRTFCGHIAVLPVLAQHLPRRMHVEHIGWAPTTSLACSEAQGNELWATGRPSVRSYPGQFIARTRRR